MRRTLLTAEIQKNVCNALRIGTPIDVTCAHVNISPATYHRWNDRGRAVLRQIEALAEENPDSFEVPDLTANDLAFAEFAEATETARAEAHVRALGIIQKAAMDGTWQAAAWYLERSFPKQYARRSGDRLDTLDKASEPDVLPTVTEERREAIILRLKEHLPQRAS